MDAPRLADVLQPLTRPVRRVASDFASAGRTAADMDWLRMGAIGGGLVLASSALDRRADQFAQDHGQNRYVKVGNSFGNALPLARNRRGRGGCPGRQRSSALPHRLRGAGGGRYRISGGHRAENRVWPCTPREWARQPCLQAPFHGLWLRFAAIRAYDHRLGGRDAFAEEYDAPWLYGLAAVTNLARVGSRNHWLSDTVAGSALGYAIGRVFWGILAHAAERRPACADSSRRGQSGLDV